MSTPIYDNSGNVVAHRVKSFPSGEYIIVRKSKVHYKTVAEARSEQRAKATQYWDIGSKDFSGF
jgi:hypothetical protein